MISFPIPHYGNLINAFILSYAVIRHQLVDIKLVIRRSTAWIILGIGAMAIYWLVLFGIQKIFNFQMDVYATIAATGLMLVFRWYNVFLTRSYLWYIDSRFSRFELSFSTKT